jgi:hypothetical protein
MLQSMKKGGPKKPSLSYEAKTAQDKALIDMKSRAEARKLRMETPLKANPSKPVEEENTFESVRKNLANAKERETDIAEREANDYGRKPVKPGEAKDYVYGGQETMDVMNKPSIKKSIENYRSKMAKMEEDYKAKTKPKK